jgi:hypothetical protein
MKIVSMNAQKERKNILKKEPPFFLKKQGAWKNFPCLKKNLKEKTININHINDLPVPVDNDLMEYLLY